MGLCYHYGWITIPVKCNSSYNANDGDFYLKKNKNKQVENKNKQVELQKAAQQRKLATCKMKRQPAEYLQIICPVRG